jgi:leader peptidase (prepilin peptidase) / N-methyltransferase
VLALLAASPAAFIAVALVLGLIVGSFLNVVIYRLPIMLERQWRAEYAQAYATDASSAGKHSGKRESDSKGTQGTACDSAAEPQPEKFNLVVPRSACPACHTPIRARDNIPLLSYLLLRGRCARCKAHISRRYPAVELLCGLMTAAVAWRCGYSSEAACAAVITWFLIALAAIDLEHQLLPDLLTLPLLWLGLLASLSGWAARGHSVPVDPTSAIAGAAIGYLALWAVYHAFRLATGKEGMGYGDFKLLAALGAWMGWQMLLPIVLIGAGVGALVGMGLIVTRQHERGHPIPFGPFLAAAGWVTLLWGPQFVPQFLGLYAPPH